MRRRSCCKSMEPDATAICLSDVLMMAKTIQTAFVCRKARASAAASVTARLLPLLRCRPCEIKPA